MGKDNDENVQGEARHERRGQHRGCTFLQSTQLWVRDNSQKASGARRGRKRNGGRRGLCAGLLRGSRGS